MHLPYTSLSLCTCETEIKCSSAGFIILWLFCLSLKKQVLLAAGFLNSSQADYGKNTLTQGGIFRTSQLWSIHLVMLLEYCSTSGPSFKTNLLPAHVCFRNRVWKGRLLFQPAAATQRGDEWRQWRCSWSLLILPDGEKAKSKDCLHQ